MKCPIQTWIKIPCPTCGTTRAMLSLLKGDIKSYFRYQPFALPLVIAVMIALHMKFITHKKVAKVYIYIVIFSNVIYYLCKFSGWVF